MSPTRAGDRALQDPLGRAAGVKGLRDTAMSDLPPESELLLRYESETLRGEYKKYFKIKTSNFVATIQKFPLIWESFQLLDEVWMREFDDLERLTDPNKMLPAILFMNGHAHFRLAFELGFSCCIGEAWNILRSGIESVAHAHKLIRESHFLKVWAEKDDGPAQARAFKNTFEKNKKKNLFPAEHGLEKLHGYWSEYSEWGTHTTVASLGRRFASDETPDDVSWRLNYFETSLQRLGMFLSSLLLASHEMEKAFFRSFEARLGLDSGLARMRARFERLAERARQDAIKRFHISPPKVWP